jgi:hypothetical protein
MVGEQHGWVHGSMVTIPVAVEAFVQREVASMRAWGHQVLVRRCPQLDSTDYGRVSFGYWLAIDDQPGCGFEPQYRGSVDELVSERYDEFRLFIAGSKTEEFPSDSGERSEGTEPPPPVPLTAEDGSTLRFVARIDSPEAARAWFSRPDAYLRCDECGWGGETVPVGDPERECDCGAFVRNDDGELVWEESHHFQYPTVYLAE